MISRRSFLKGSLYSLTIPYFIIVGKVLGLDHIHSFGLPLCLGETCLASNFVINPVLLVDPTGIKLNNFSGRKTNFLDYFRK